MGSVFEVIKKRRSVRRFGQREVENEKLNVILEAARLAPSSENSQTWHFIVVRRRETIQRLAEAVPIGPKAINRWIKTAPLLIAACARPDPILHRMGQIVDKDYHRVDVAIAVEHMVLTATDLGIDSCIVGWFSRRKARRILELPLSMEVVLLLALGYGSEKQRGSERPRKRLEDIVSFESYQTAGRGKESNCFYPKHSGGNSENSSQSPGSKKRT